MDLIPAAFLFRFALPIPFVPDLPHKTGGPCGDALQPIPLFSDLDQPDQPVQIALGWNENGIGITLDVSGKTQPPRAQSIDLAGDGLTIWIDTRDARTAHRASRYCHEFRLCPHVGKSKTTSPRIIKRDIAMARDFSPAADEKIPIQSLLHDTGYHLEAWIPAPHLNGFDPEQAPRIGFHAILTDEELGERFLTVGTDFATDRDPSLWTTLELARDPARNSGKKNSRARRPTQSSRRRAQR